MNINLSTREKVRNLASGGFGDTALYEDAGGNRFVIKTYAPKGGNDSPKALQMFKEECDRLREIGDHPQLPGYLGFEESEGQYLIAQQYIPGKSLREILSDERLYTPEEALDLVQAILDPLNYLHSHRMIHRDIKPANIIVNSVSQKPCLVDFGAAKIATQTVLARTATTIGSVLYASPEQMSGKPCFASDIYSLGLTVIELITGQEPFATMDFHSGEWTWEAAVPKADPRIVKILKKMIARNLRDRYSSVDQVQADIDEFHQYSLEESRRLEKEARKQSIALALKRERNTQIRRLVFRRVLPISLGGAIAVTGGVMGWQKLDMGTRIAEVGRSLTPKPSPKPELVNPKPKPEQQEKPVEQDEVSSELLGHLDTLFFVAKVMVGGSIVLAAFFTLHKISIGEL